jgi:hypothetical protein
LKKTHSDGTLLTLTVQEYQGGKHIHHQLGQSYLYMYFEARKFVAKNSWTMG